MNHHAAPEQTLTAFLQYGVTRYGCSVSELLLFLLLRFLSKVMGDALAFAARAGYSLRVYKRPEERAPRVLDSVCRKLPRLRMSDRR